MYKKNDKEYQIINDKKQNNIIEQSNEIETETEETINQRKITEFFIQNIRKETEEMQITDSNDRQDIHENDDDNQESISTQQWIKEARERRGQMRNRINCDKCTFKTTSDTALKLHQNANHRNKTE